MGVIYTLYAYGLVKADCQIDSKCPKLEHHTYKDAFTQENPMFRTNRKSNAIQDDKCYAEEFQLLVSV
ncbi:Rna Cytosine C(5)-Methyltransferase Nsun2 [Manis pentadactyla]|nr:Rna Cytosine C(5)-Methyltransferase Nsun2 [Manis pentadactyla]